MKFDHKTGSPVDFLAQTQIQAAQVFAPIKQQIHQMTKENKTVLKQPRQLIKSFWITLWMKETDA